MHRFTSAAIGLLVSLGAAGVAAAQSTAPTAPTTPPAASAAQAVGKGKGGLYKDLGLTATQKAQLKAIRQKYRSQGKGGRANEMAEVRALLTPAQQQKFDVRVSAARTHRSKGHRAHGQAPGNP